jgi:hypothetical protein
MSADGRLVSADSFLIGGSFCNNDNINISDKIAVSSAQIHNLFYF